MFESHGVTETSNLFQGLKYLGPILSIKDIPIADEIPLFQSSRKGY